MPSGLKNVLRAHGLFLECFCGFLSDRLNPKSCQIILSSATGDVLGFCHYDSPRCGFFINFTEIYNKCFLTSVYGHLPTLASGNVPDMDALCVAFTLHQLLAQGIAPHFEGYFGEHISEFPTGTRQQSGPLLKRTPSHGRSSTRRHSTPYARMQKEVPASNQRYLEIDDGYPRNRQVQTAPAFAGPSRILMKSASAAAPFRAVDDGGDDDRERKETKYLSICAVSPRGEVRHPLAGVGTSNDLLQDLGHRQRAGSFVPFTVILNGELVVATKSLLALMPESGP
ncbi:hypothetical protein DFH09DRAFT_1341998 [Mycena vulgaris]|nr:hypothetical protein DFH09DRAFT_1341998 [Mycena vulgaris]